MLRCFRDCLIKPKFIANHLNMKPIAFIGYILILTLFISAPLYVNYYCNSSIANNLTERITSDLTDNSVVLPFKVEDNKLIKTADSAILTMVSLPSLGDYNGQSLIPVYLVFNPGNGEVKLENNMAIFIMLNKTKVEIILNTGQTETYNPDLISIASESSIIKTYSYNELEAEGLDFNQINSYSDFTFKINLEKVIDKVIKPYMGIVNVVVIPTVFITSILSLLLETLIVTLCMLLFLRFLGISFGRLFKLTILCMTPMAVFSVLCLFPLGDIWTYGVMLLGQLLTVIYLFIASRGVAGQNLYNNQQ